MPVPASYYNEASRRIVNAIVDPLRPEPTWLGVRDARGDHGSRICNSPPSAPAMKTRPLPESTATVFGWRTVG